MNIKYIIDPLNSHAISKIVFKKGKGKKERQKERKGVMGRWKIKAGRRRVKKKRSNG